ncbi:MAG TPA: MarR family transcriptional regulator [Methanospirillum sp.]|nr:MarR family transcriptional regulator [Methanospirillum sp.]
MKNEEEPGYTILRNKRNVSRFQILVEIAEHQPAVRQQEIAAMLGVTPQAISEYIRDLVDDGMIRAPGRGRYEVTRAGIEWILRNAEVLESYARHVRHDIIHQVTVWTAIAAENLKQGDRVGVYMKSGLLYASKHLKSANGEVIADTPKGEDVGVSKLEGIIEHRESIVQVSKVPRIERGGSRSVNADLLRTVVSSVSVVACVGLEAWVSLKKIGRVPDLYYGSREGVIEAALHGIPCAIVIVDEFFTDFLKQLEQSDLTYEIHDLVVS